MQRRSILPCFDGEAGRKCEQVQIPYLLSEAAGKGTARTTRDCRKSESEVNLPHE
jgi:hypothetical protein